MAVTTAQVQALYIAYFNRPADFFGLTFQVNQANTLGLPFVADQFSKSPEYIATYAGKGTAEIIDTIYMNLFGRHAEPAGLKFWGDLLTNPKSGITIGNAALTIFNGALNDDKIAVTNKVTAAEAFYASLDTNAEIVGYSGDAANQVLKAWMGTITTDASLAANTTAVALAAVSASATAAHDGAIQVTTALTTGIDNFVGTAASDTIVAILDNNNNTDTLTALDSIDGGNGLDTLQINDLGASSPMPLGLVVKNVETINIRGAGAVTVDSSTFTGVTALNVAQSAAATVTAGSGTAMTVTGATGAISATGGSTQTLSSDGANITSTKAAGAVSATLTTQAGADVSINGGTAVTVNATGASTGGQITIGNATAPTGAVIVNSTGIKSVANTDITLGAIAVTGGSSVVITQHASGNSAAALTDTNGATHTESAISVTGSSKTTSVTVVQDATVAESAAIDHIAGTAETQVFTFAALAATQVATFDGLSFTAAGAMTAAQVAAAFANLSAGATHGHAAASLGVYSGQLGTDFHSGAVVTASGLSKVTFTQEDIYQGPVGALAATINAVANVPVVTAGVAEVDLEEGSLGITAGAVTIDGSAPTTKVLASVTLDGFGASTINSDALTSLSLAHGTSSVAVSNAVATTLGLALNDVTGGAALTLPTYTTLNVATTTKSAVAITAAAATTLAISGAGATDLTGSAMVGLKTVTIAGAGGATLAAGLAATITSVDASASSGSNTATIDTAIATYTGGSGADSVTLSSATTTKAVNLGAGNDTLTLAATTTSLTAAMNGGDGTDTLRMNATDAATASLGTTFAAKIDGFEKLRTNATTAVTAIDLSNMDNINYVISGGMGGGFTLGLTKMAANGTLELIGAAATVTDATTVTLADATGTADVFNIVTKVSTAALNFGVVAVAGVETINITATDTSTTAGIQAATLKVTDSAAKSIVVSGNGDLVLTTTSVVLTSLDGSAMTGKLTATANGTVAETIKGGTAADTLTSAGTNDVLIGNGGNDVLKAASNLVTLTGGAGADTFDVSVATSNVNSYATVTDLAAGDLIKFASGDAFLASKVTLADTAVFQDYANQAINLTDDGDISWFTYGGNTYVIEHNSADASTSFVNGADIIVKITGTALDLSTAAFNTTTQTLLIA
jgi:S-layer protein